MSYWVGKTGALFESYRLLFVFVVLFDSVYIQFLDSFTVFTAGIFFRSFSRFLKNLCWMLNIDSDLEDYAFL